MWSWYLFAYSRFAYSHFVYLRPKSGISPTLNKKTIFGHQSDIGVSFHQCPTESRTDVHLGGEWTKTASDEDFFIAEDGQGEDRLIMFAMSNIVKTLEMEKDIGMAFQKV